MHKFFLIYLCIYIYIYIIFIYIYLFKLPYITTLLINYQIHLGFLVIVQIVAQILFKVFIYL